MNGVMKYHLGVVCFVKYEGGSDLRCGLVFMEMSVKEVGLCVYVGVSVGGCGSMGVCMDGCIWDGGCVYMCVCVYVCMCVCVYVCMCVCAKVFMSGCADVCMWISEF